MLAIQEDEEAGILQLIVYKLFLQDVSNRLSLAVDFCPHWLKYKIVFACAVHSNNEGMVDVRQMWKIDQMLLA